ncbi:hypothetical protein EsH8_IX_000390 [Colletotrichum jinshuiense]
MQAFKLRLPDGKTVSGLHSIPPAADKAADRAAYRPLIVGLHGASYSSAYFDVDSYSAKHISVAMGVPFIAIDRPGYEYTSPIESIPEESSFYEEWGTFLHRSILPALWVEFAVPNGCSSISLHCHSMGTPGACVAAALHAEEASPTYPLAAVSLSGFGNAVANVATEETTPPANPPPTISLPYHVKDAIMIPPGTADPSVYTHTARLDRPMPYREQADLRRKWLETWHEKFAGKIQVPVLIALAEQDKFFLARDKDVQEYAAAFTGSQRVEGSVIPGAPHNLEMSYWSQGWYARAFGFALEATASLAIGDGSDGALTEH